MSNLDERLKKGSFVISKAGHDRGEILIVLDFNEQFAYLADGKRRLARKPKKKKLIHLQVTKSYSMRCAQELSEGTLPDNSVISKEI